jgi:DNA-binding transcriptional ArsR family regulator
MSTNLNSLQELALDLVAHSYESVAALEAEVRLLMGNGVSKQQITAALEALRELGLADAYTYRDSDGVYLRYRRDKLKPGVDVSWYASDSGRELNAASA